MKQGNRIVWKLSVAGTLFVSLVIVAFACLDTLLQQLGLDEASSFAWRVALVVVALAANLVVLRRVFIRLIGQPIDTMIAGTRRVAEGDLLVEFSSERDDEIGELENSFSYMTKRLRASLTELRDAMEYLEGIVENSADIIITVTPWHLIQRFNRGAEQALGYRREEVQGKRIEILFANPEDRKRALAQLDHTDNVTNYSTDFLTKTGEIRNVLLTLSRLRDSEGNPIGTFGISKDITEERKLLRQLIRTKRHAAIGEAVTGIQHAIKNMLNALKGGAYLVKLGIRDDKRDMLEQGWSMVEEGIERMSALSLSLLNYAKDWTPEYEETDLNLMVTKIHEVVAQSAGDKGIEVLAEIEGGEAVVPCDPKLIHMAIMDIVSNAIDACAWKDYSNGESAEVVLRTNLDRRRRRFTIGIQDNGCGMSEEIVRNIFTPFFSTKKKWGTGLGLALTSRVIDVHGGTIQVESKPDEGTTFRVVLPLDAAGPTGGKEALDGQESTAD